ncbi:MAG: transposase [Planctomycetaceae bacterium]|nr:transposase [Planctomycetaceae bacterium]
MAKRTPVIAYHLIWTGYGHWLPNDPRGSGSHVVRADVLRDLGELHHGRKRVQPPGRVIRKFSQQAEPRLRFPVLRFNREQIDVIANTFAEVMTEQRYTCFACAIMPDHVHVCIRKHRDKCEQMVAALQGKSRLRLIEHSNFDQDHPVWTAGNGWSVYLERPEDVYRTIRYVKRNPRVPQIWPFVTEYDNWPFHKNF